jgi:hypothetical protein
MALSCKLLTAALRPFYCLPQPFEMDERAVFLKFELFAKRLNKLIDMFTTIYQFSSLEQHTHIAGVQSCTFRMYYLTLLLVIQSSVLHCVFTLCTCMTPPCAHASATCWRNTHSPFCLACGALLLLPAGLEAVLKSLYTIIDDVKRKPYDLLDYSQNQFDRDYLEFNVNIHNLEISLLVR